MTEVEWMTCGDPEKMLQLLRGKASDRKLRLLAVACCRAEPERDDDGFSRSVIEAADRYADGLVTEEERSKLHSSVYYFLDAIESDNDTERTAFFRSLICVIHDDPVYSATYVSVHWRGVEVERARRAILFKSIAIHDIFGLLPFVPTTVDPSVLTWNDRTIPRIAQGIYIDRAFDRMPILHDALLDAGCSDELLLSHCRNPESHVRGCWAVDLLLGKK